MPSGKHPIRFAIIGCGVIAPTHARSILELPAAELVAACDILPERAENLVNEFGGVAYKDSQEMFRNEKIDVVNVCTPSGLHAEIGIRAAQAGIHVIVEKPIDIKLSRVDELIHACQVNDVKLGSISQHRFDPAIVQLKKAINSGKLGRIVFAGAYTQWYRSNQYYQSGSWRGTWSLEGGGALINQGIHYVDLLQYLTGPIYSLHAYSENISHPEIEVEDTTVASLRLHHGLGVIEAMTSAFPGFCTRLEIFGTEGGVVIEDDRVKEWKIIGEEYNPTDNSTGRSIAGSSSVNIWHLGHKRQIQDFIHAVQDEREPAINGIEGRKPLEIVRAIYASSKHKKEILFPYQDE